MNVRIGITQVVKELEVDLGDEADAAAVRSEIETTLADETATLWLTDKKGRQVGVPVAKVAYVDLGAPDEEQRIGFG